MSYTDEEKIANVADKIENYISELDTEDKNYALHIMILNMVSYSIHTNCSRINWIARDLFEDVIPEEFIKQMFDEK